MPAPFALDRRRRRTLHRQIYLQLREAILSSRLLPGDRLPSTRELATALRVARTTVTGAYDQLSAEGYLEARLGAGTFVGRELPERAPRSARARRIATAAPAIRVSSFAARLPPLASRRLPQPGVIDLSAAASDLPLFPTAVWSRLVRRALRRRGAPADPPSVAGDTRLREAIAAYLGRSRAVRCTPDQVLVTSGSQQALDLCARVLVNRGDHVAMEEPGYPEGRHLFAASGAVVHPVPVDGDAEFIREGHFERHVRRMRRVYARRHSALIEALDRHLGDRAAVVGEPAGLHAVVRVTGLDADAGRRAGVAFESTRPCYAGVAPANEILVRFAGVGERTLREGVRRLARR